VVHNHVWDVERGGGGPLSGKLDVGHAERLFARSDKLEIDYLCVSAP
jgi:hypothetical protein